MNIFQPAIDITDNALEKEIGDIVNFLHKLGKSKNIMVEAL